MRIELRPFWCDWPDWAFHAGMRKAGSSDLGWPAFQPLGSWVFWLPVCFWYFSAGQKNPTAVRRSDSDVVSSVQSVSVYMTERWRPLSSAIVCLISAVPTWGLWWSYAVSVWRTFAKVFLLFGFLESGVKLGGGREILMWKQTFSILLCFFDVCDAVGLTVGLQNGGYRAVSVRCRRLLVLYLRVCRGLIVELTY